jgi:hypothetical protein
MNMQQIIILLSVFACLVLAYQTWVTVLLCKASNRYTRTQLAAKLCLIWMLPLLGASACYFSLVLVDEE